MNNGTFTKSQLLSLYLVRLCLNWRDTCLCKRQVHLRILFTGRLNQVEYSEHIDPILFSTNGDKSHLHNQLLAAIYGNLTREMPDVGLAPWVSANDKPTIGVGAKPVTGDAAERKLKGEVMQLPTRDRRRIKELVNNDVRDDTDQTP